MSVIGTVPPEPVIPKVPVYDAEPKAAVMVVLVTVEATFEFAVTLNVEVRLLAGTVKLVTLDVEFPSVVIV